MAPCLITVGHGTASQAGFTTLLCDAGLTRLGPVSKSVAGGGLVGCSGVSEIDNG
jgi:hypothetical protein